MQRRHRCGRPASFWGRPIRFRCRGPTFRAGSRVSKSHRPRTKRSSYYDPRLSRDRAFSSLENVLGTTISAAFGFTISRPSAQESHGRELAEKVTKKKKKKKKKALAKKCAARRHQKLANHLAALFGVQSTGDRISGGPMVSFGGLGPRMSSSNRTSWARCSLPNPQTPRPSQTSD